MTLKLTIRLFGTLSFRVPGYNHKTGIIVIAGDDTTPEEILKCLRIPLTHIGVISDGKHPLKRDNALTDGMTIHVFSLISGG